MTRPEGATPASDGDDAAIPGARLLLEQMVRLNDIQISAVDHLRAKSRAYLSVGAIAVTASAAFLALASDLPGELWIGSVVALVLFGISAILAVLAERSATIPDAPDVYDMAGLVSSEDAEWSEDQITLWVAREHIERIQPIASREVLRTARLVDLQLILFLGEVVAVGVTLTIALAS